MHIDPMEETQLPYTAGRQGVEDSYAAHIAYKFAVWILNRRDSTRISTLEDRAIGDSLTPPFVNQSDMCRLDINEFFKMFICYLVLLDTIFSNNPHTILIELKNSPTRTGFDDLISGLTHSFCRLTHASPIDLQDREG